MKKGSLRLRLLLAAGASIALALFLTGLAVMRLFEGQVRERVVADLDYDLMLLAGAMDVTEDGRVVIAQAPSDPRYQEPYGGRYWRIDFPLNGAQTGLEPLRSRSFWDSDLDLARAVGPQGEPLIISRSDISIQRNGKPQKVSLIAAAEEDEVQRPVGALRQQLMLSLSMIGSTLILASWLQVIVGLRPLDQIRRHVGEIREGRARRLSGSFPDEVAPLVTELNGLLELRDLSLERARRRAGDLAHGLKTPLTVMAAVARDLAQDGRQHAAAEIEEQTDIMVRHVERTLARARLSSGKGHAATELKHAVERVVAAMARMPGAEELDFDIAVPAGQLVPVEQDDLTELLGNLLDNARKWARSKVRVSHENGLLVIEDDGPGVAEADLVLIGQRGQRLDETIQGSGLGLSIVADIADLYGLGLSFSRSELGGFRAEIRL